MATDPVSSQADIDASVVENTTGLVTPTVLHRILTGINSIGLAGFITVGGVLYLNPAAIAPGSITADKLAPGVIGAGASLLTVPTRTVSGAAAALTGPTDYLLILNGPSEVDLEHAPPIGTTHIIKQTAAASSNPVNVVAASGDTIDGATSLTFPSSPTKAGLSLSYTSLGWAAY